METGNKKRITFYNNPITYMIVGESHPVKSSTTIHHLYDFRGIPPSEKFYNNSINYMIVGESHPMKSSTTIPSPT